MKGNWRRNQEQVSSKKSSNYRLAVKDEYPCRSASNGWRQSASFSIGESSINPPIRCKWEKLAASPVKPDWNKIIHLFSGSRGFLYLLFKMLSDCSLALGQ